MTIPEGYISLTLALKRHFKRTYGEEFDQTNRALADKITENDLAFVTAFAKGDLIGLTWNPITSEPDRVPDEKWDVERDTDPAKSHARARIIRGEVGLTKEGSHTEQVYRTVFLREEKFDGWSLQNIHKEVLAESEAPDPDPLPGKQAWVRDAIADMWQGKVPKTYEKDGRIVRAQLGDYIFPRISQWAYENRGDTIGETTMRDYLQAYHPDVCRPRRKRAPKGTT